jgi:hypothetical protein
MPKFCEGGDPVALINKPQNSAHLVFWGSAALIDLIVLLLDIVKYKG